MSGALPALVLASALGCLGAAALILLVRGLAAARRRLCVVTVNGLSMEPTLLDGDRVLVRRVPLGAVRAGQLVVLTGPAGQPGDWIVKRAVAVPGDPVPRASVPALAAAAEPAVPDGSLVVLGDNARLSLDSRRLGYLPAGRLVGVVIRRYPARQHPSTPRAGSAAGRLVGARPAAAMKGESG